MARVTAGQCDGCGWLQTGMNCAVFWKRSEAWFDENGDCEARRTPTQAEAARGEMAAYEAATEGRTA